MTEKTNSPKYAPFDITSKYKKILKKKIYFGHQSVGYNIIDGINEIVKNNPTIKLNIIKTKNLDHIKNPVFTHSPIGENLNPISKIDDFANIMNQSMGNKIDIAFFKLCFIDITQNTDVHKIFTYYRDTMAQLKKLYPKTTFIHVTVPLTIKETSIKALIKNAKDIVKKIIGRPFFNYNDNINRKQYNELLKKEYNKNQIFDLALIESTYPDGRRSSFCKNGETYYTLVQDYTYDSGHLNKNGSSIVAHQLLIFLSGL